MIKVRFNLSRNKYYKFWKITYGKDNSVYYDPKFFDIVMKKCKLKNHRKTADKIFCGANKSVCAWIECDEVKIISRQEITNISEKISYNPRVAPYWRNGKNEDIDNFNYEELVGISGEVFLN